MWDAQLAGDGPGILKVLQDVALFPLAGGQVFWDKQAHGNPTACSPCCRSSQAATELSTPPLIATAMESCK